MATEPDFQTNLCKALIKLYDKGISFNQLKQHDVPFKLSKINFITLRQVAGDNHKFIVYYIKQTYSYCTQEIKENNDAINYLINECPILGECSEYLNAIITDENAEGLINKLSYQTLFQLSYSIADKYNSIMDARICRIICDTPEQITEIVPFKFINAYASACDLDHQYDTEEKRKQALEDIPRYETLERVIKDMLTKLVTELRTHGSIIRGGIIAAASSIEKN